MNKLIITSFLLLFLFPSVSYSTTFKCQFIQQWKPEDGKLNGANCSDDPERVFATTEDLYPRNELCKIDKGFWNKEYVVDLDKKIRGCTR